MNNLKKPKYPVLNVLYLPIKKRWFDMIASGEKKEEYREFKDYWCKRLYFAFNVISLKSEFKQFDFVCFKNGYQKDAPELWVACKGIRLGRPKPEWSDNWDEVVFVIELGRILAKPVVL